MSRQVAETRTDRLALAHDAGLGAISPLSVLAGVLVAYGCFAVLGAIAGGVLAALGVHSVNDLAGNWRDQTIGGAGVVALVLFLSYFFGGYVAGRMARRAGAANGLMVFVLSLLIAVGVGAAIATQTGTDAALANLRSIGVPTTTSDWTGIGTIAGAAALLAMLLGAMLGGVRGERWHGKLMARALDPTIGPEIDLRDRRDGEEWDGENRTRVLTGTSTTLDEDLYRATADT
jgi:hypothetical protein